MSRLEELVAKFKSGEVADHVYMSDGASRDPECAVAKCRWCYVDHLDRELLKIVKETSRERN